MSWQPYKTIDHKQTHMTGVKTSQLSEVCLIPELSRLSKVDTFCATASFQTDESLLYNLLFLCKHYIIRCSFYRGANIFYQMSQAAVRWRRLPHFYCLYEIALFCSLLGQSQIWSRRFINKKWLMPYNVRLNAPSF